MASPIATHHSSFASPKIWFGALHLEKLYWIVLATNGSLLCSFNNPPCTYVQQLYTITTIKSTNY